MCVYLILYIIIHVAIKLIFGFLIQILCIGQFMQLLISKLILFNLVKIEMLFDFMLMLEIKKINVGLQK